MKVFDRLPWRGLSPFRWLTGLKSALVDLLAPRRCAGCEERWLPGHEGYWCDACLKELPRIRSPMCPRCGLPHSSFDRIGDFLCARCLQEGYHFDGARSATFHKGLVREHILGLKFGGEIHRAPPLAQLLATTLEEHPLPRADLLAPVPLHVRRLRQRGFNQTAVLAGFLGPVLGIPVKYTALSRKRWLRPQTRLSRAERLVNVRDNFFVEDPSVARGKRVLLLDDVFTTGTTLDECAKVLRQAGASKVYALTVSRVVPGKAAEKIGPPSPVL